MSNDKKNHSVQSKKERKAIELKKLAELDVKAKDFKAYLDLKSFSELPISEKTKEGLKQSNFVEQTEIQQKALPLALSGKDILGAAKTGSGKTLAFLIPVLEVLYRAKWSQFDGLGALVISPTRELAIQIFEVLKKIGKKHAFSAGLVIGGKDLEAEMDVITRMNILICTPGRLLQHMDQTVGFECPNLQILVLDEADRILDMGFEKTVNAIVENLPSERQTLLFSATQTKSVRDLARLSLKEPEYVAVHDKSEHSTPQSLSQHYLICPLPNKLDILYSFIKTHLTAKAIVFVSSCKQVRFLFETFCKLHPGVPLLHIHGKQKQQKRLEIFTKFTSIKNAFLFATDIAARGLDFPAVDWVIQLDCPEDAETYIHRVGRTARYGASGQALLFLLPSEEGILEELQKKKVPINLIKVRHSKQQSIQKQLQSFCFHDAQIKYLGQKAFVSYIRSVYLQKNKNIFKVHDLPAEEYAASLGLPGAPKIKFIKKSQAKNAMRDTSKNVPGLESFSDREESEESEESEIEEGKIPTRKIQMPSIADDSGSDNEDNQVKDQVKGVKTKYDRMFGRKNQDILSSHYQKIIDHKSDNLNEGGDDDDDFLTVKRVDHDLEELDEPLLPMSKRQLKMTKKERVSRMSKGVKLIFDEEGNAHEIYEMEDEKKFLQAGDPRIQKQKFITKSLEVMQSADREDKEIAKEKRKAKRQKQKMQEEQSDDNFVVSLDDSQNNDNEHNSSILMDDDQDSHSDISEKEIPWFKRRARDMEEEKTTKKRRKIIEVEHPKTLEDQERLALQLLEGV